MDPKKHSRDHKEKVHKVVDHLVSFRQVKYGWKVPKVHVDVEKQESENWVHEEVSNGP